MKGGIKQKYRKTAKNARKWGRIEEEKGEK